MFQSLVATLNTDLAHMRHIVGDLLHTPVGHTDTVSQVCLSYDEQILFSGSHNETAKVWNLDGKLLQTLEGHSDGIYHPPLSPDGS
jgi:WD40 repeat protein